MFYYIDVHLLAHYIQYSCLFSEIKKETHILG
jgi:hypothetical protein